MARLVLDEGAVMAQRCRAGKGGDQAEQPEPAAAEGCTMPPLKQGGRIVKRIATVILATLLLSPNIVKSADGVSAQEPSSPSLTAAQTKKLDINRATLAELVAVPGIGSRMAQAIVDLRSKKGSFARLDDLLEVPGIKEKKLASLTAYLVVVPPKAAAQPSAAPQSR
jgi:competence protein ComEA